MSKQVLVILIDPEKREVSADTIEDDLESMQQMVGGNIERVYVDLPIADEVLWADEEGKLKENFHYHVKGFADILSGKSFICREVDGNDGFVNDDTQLDVATIEELIEWLPHLDNAQLL